MDEQAQKSLRTSLQLTYISFQEIARCKNIHHTFEKLKSGIYGFVYRSSFLNYYIIINKNLTVELQKEVFCHEVQHILKDMPETGYVIGLDMQYSSFEKEADEFARAVGNIFFTQ